MTSSISFLGVQSRAVSSGDPYWANVVLLVGNNNGADGTTTFTDQSSYARTITTVGSSQWDTAQYPTGLTSSVLLDGSGDYLTVADSADWTFGTGDYTLEIWVRFASVGNIAFFDFESSVINRSWAFYRDSGTLYMREGATIHSFGAWTPSTGTWYHVAVSRSSSTTRAFIDGTQIGTDKAGANIPDITSTLKICGLDWIGSYDLNGWFGSARITKGVGRYTANFTPPTLPLFTSNTDAYFSSVVLLAGNNNGADASTTFTDQSSYAKTVTAVGNAQWDTAAAPTGLTSSVLLDGTGDYLSCAHGSELNLSTSNFAAEMWVRTATTSGVHVLWAKRANSLVYAYFVFVQNGTALQWFCSSNGTSWDIANALSIGTIATGSFYHIALARTGTSFEPYLNGTRGSGTATSSAAITDNTSAIVLGSDTDAFGFNGWIASARLTVGSNRGYTGATIAVPSLPLANS